MPEAELAEIASGNDDGHGPWSREAMMLAAVRDELAWLRWTTVAIKSEKGKQPPHPRPYPRPGVPREAPKASRKATPQGTAYLQSLRERHRQIQTQAEAVTGDGG